MKWLIPALLLSSCATETVTTRTTTAKGHVVETVTVTRKADPAALSLANTAVTVLATPRALRVREEKSGRITPAEIAARFRPSSTDH